MHLACQSACSLACAVSGGKRRGEADSGDAQVPESGAAKPLLHGKNENRHAFAMIQPLSTLHPTIQPIRACMELTQAQLAQRPCTVSP